MTAFPAAVIEVLEDELPNHFPDYEILTRPLAQTDPALSVGVFATDWRPEPGSEEIGGLQPTINNYLIRLQAMTKNTDRQEGRANASTAGSLLRTMLYRDPTLRVRLTQLQYEAMGGVERLQRYGVQTQRFLNNELRGTFVHFVSTDFWVQTSIT